MLRFLLTLILIAAWPGTAARGEVPGTPPYPASPQNQAPQTVDYIDVRTLHVGGSSETVNVSDYFSDPDGDNLTYSVNNPSPSVATVSISGSTVTIRPVAIGTTGKIVVTARDAGGLTATQDFNVTVQAAPPPNQAPTAVGSISDVTLQVGGSSATRNVSGKFSDPDNDTLTYSVNSPNPTIVTVSISGSTVTITPKAAGTTGKIIVTARDPGGLTATQDFTATVEEPPPNQAPTAVGSISDVTLQEGGSSATRDVSGKFSDPDGDTLTYSVNSPDPSIVTVSISGSTVTIAPVAAGTTGKIIVTARDPDGLTVTQDFTATVEEPPPPANEAPTTVGYISDVTLSKGGSSATRNVSNKFSDPDDDTLAYSVNNPNPSIATVSISGSTVTITPVAKGSTGKIIVTATDPGGLSATQDFTATVINDPPEAVGSIADVTLYKNGKTRSISVSSKFTDPNGDALTYSASSNKTSVATASVSGSTVTVRSGAKGTATITVTATDPDDATDTQDFDVSVVNRHPGLRKVIPEMTFHRKQAARSVDLSDHFVDDDNDALTYTASSSNTSVATVSLSGSSLSVDPGELGTASITVTATDTDNASRQHSFSVDVANRPPVVSQDIADLSLYKNRSTTINASSHFRDDDGDTITFSARSSNTGMVGVSVSGSTVTIESEDDGGDATVTVTATDSHNDSVSDSFTVTVLNRSPQADGSIDAVSLFKNNHALEVVVSDKFTDPDDDTLRFTASTNNSSVATASASDSTVTITSGNSGRATITVKAEDIDKASAEQTIRVTVRNRAPEVVDSFEDVILRVNGPSKRFDVSGNFSDPDTDTLTFSVNDPKPSIAAVSISGSVVTVAPKIEGEIGKVKVTASDNEDSISEEFRVVVEREQTITPSCPTANTVPVMVPTVSAGGDSATMVVSAYFTIPEGVTVTYEVNNPDSTIANVSISGDTLTIEPRTQGHTGKVEITASANDCDDVTRDFNIVVGPARPITPSCPTANTVPITVPTVSAGGDSATMVVSAYFTVPEDVTPTYIVNDPNPNVATFSMSGDTLTIRPVKQGTIGNVNLTARTTDCTDVSRAFELTVGPAQPITPPSCPTANTVPVTVPFMCAEGDSVTMDVSAYFTIPEGVTPTYSVNNPSPGIATVSISGDTLTIEPKAQGQTGKIVVTVSATNCTDVTRDFNVSVPAAPSASDCPAVKQMHPSRDVSLTVGGSDFEVNLNSHFTNLGSTDVNYSIASSNSGVATAIRTGTTLAISPGTTGTAQVTVSVSRCGCSTAASQVFNITVSPSCPSADANNPIPSQTLTVGGGNKMIVVSSHFKNVSGGGTTYSASSSDTSVVTVSNSDASLTISPEGDGTTTITVTASKSGCTTPAEQSFTATVTSTPPPEPNVASVTVSPASASIEEGETRQFAATALDSANVKILGKTFTWTSDSTAVATIDTLGLATAQNAGSTTITATTDGVSGTASLTVTDPSTPPPSTCPAVITDVPIPDQALFAGAGVTRIDLTEHFERIDQDDIEVTVTSPSPETAVLSIEGSVLKIEPKSAGRIDTVTVTVTDTSESDPCDAVSLSFMITVMDPSSAPWSVSGENVYRLDGNVGIGEGSPDQKLVVDGKIRAEEVYMSMTPADYVFEADYDLMPLEDVARHIGEHGHLPGVASGAEMKANGIGISRMQTLLLEKIEELSLHVIDQHEQLRAQGQSIDSQQRRLELQIQRMGQLDQRLERLEQ